MARGAAFALFLLAAARCDESDPCAGTTPPIRPGTTEPVLLPVPEPSVPGGEHTRRFLLRLPSDYCDETVAECTTRRDPVVLDLQCVSPPTTTTPHRHPLLPATASPPAPQAPLRRCR